MTGQPRIAARRAFAVAAAAILAVLAAAGPARAYDKFIMLGTASVSGTYHPVGNSICKLLNDDREKHRVRCLAYATGGSVYNIQALSSGELDMAITRSDLAYKAYHGLEQFESIGPNRALRTVTNLYSQPVIVTVHKDSGIESFDDIAGKVLNIGNQGSGKRAIAEQMFKIMGWSAGHFSALTEYSTRTQSTPFCERKVDILIEAIGLPSPLYDKLARDCGARFIDLPPKLIAGFEATGKFFFEYEIPAAVNPNNADDVRTVGINVVLLTLATVSDRTVRTVAEALFRDQKAFVASHPALSLTTPDLMVRRGIRVPLHDGAAAYYRESDLLAPQQGASRSTP